VEWRSDGGAGIPGDNGAVVVVVCTRRHTGSVWIGIGQVGAAKTQKQPKFKGPIFPPTPL